MNHSTTANMWTMRPSKLLQPRPFPPNPQRQCRKRGGHAAHRMAFKGRPTKGGDLAAYFLDRITGSTLGTDGWSG
ncbi:MAG: hypothetical protein IT427_18685 [Pirellulales bacterium]|nr:hypothetical protein [Pirellulales bacterium]